MDAYDYEHCLTSPHIPFGISKCTYFAITRQARMRSLRTSLKTHRKRSQCLLYSAQYESGKHTIASLATSLHFSPCMLARLFLEMKHPLKTKKDISLLLKNTENIVDLQLQEDVRECLRIDTDVSPRIDCIRHNVGIQYEYYLELFLKKENIVYETEEQLRTRGLSKTPDALLEIPFGVKHDDGSFHLVHWIDSKAMFGDTETHTLDNIVQLQGYVNRFGPGLVIYWFGYLTDLQKNDEILLSDCFPTNLVRSEKQFQ